MTNNFFLLQHIFSEFFLFFQKINFFWLFVFFQYYLPEICGFHIFWYFQNFSHIDFIFFILNIWRFQKISKIFVTLVLRRILMRVKRQLQNEFFSILVSITKSVKLTMVKGQWTGWNKKKNAVLRLLLRRLQLLGGV